MKAVGKTLVVLMFISAGVAAFRSHWDRPVVPTVSRALVAKGDVVQVVTATGTLAPARSVAVGSQVSGTVKRLHADYNAIVKKGDVLAEIDPEKAKAQLESVEAVLSQAKSSPEAVLPTVSPVAALASGSAGSAWRVDQHRLVRVPVKLGLTDGTWVEVTGGDLKEGDVVITAITSPVAPGARGSGAGARDPFAPVPQFRGRF